MVLHLRASIAPAVIAFCASWIPATDASAQQPAGAIAVEVVGSASTTSSAPDDPFLMLDAVVTARIGRGLDLVIRPYAHRLPGGEWSAEMYELEVRYQTGNRVPIRIDAGIISSPLGVSTLELRPDRNPTIGGPFYYFAPLPRFDDRYDGVQLISAGYPLGVVVSASGDRWDARAGITDGTAAREREIFSASRPAGEPQFVAGAGMTALPGLRIGGGLGRGAYRSRGAVASDASLDSGAAVATVINLEADYAIGYTRLTGEWIIDRFETMKAPAVARGFNLQAVRALSPRWFAAARGVRVSAPMFTGVGRERRSAASTELTLGYRLNTELTLRGGYQGSRWFTRQEWQHAAAVSVVWAKRWW